MNVTQLHKLGYCVWCSRPFQPGDEIAEPRLPDGTRSRIHASCLGGDPVEPPPTNGGTPIALAA